MAKLYLDICLSDIPKERISTAANGKKYLKAMVSPRKQPDDKGYDHYIAVYVPKDQRNPDDKPIFIGKAQDKEAQQAERERFYSKPQPPQPEQPEVDDSFPF